MKKSTSFNPSYESNYDKVRETWRQKFLTMDHENLIRRFHLASDDSSLYLTYFSHSVRIDRNTGVITYKDFPEKPLPFNTVINIYNMFHYAIENPVASGKLVPFRQVKRVYPFERAYQQTILKGFRDHFTGQVPALIRACEKLGGTRLPQGDAGYILPVFPFLNIAVLFWDADDEFEAQTNMLFDSEITSFMHEENVVGIASDALYYLTEAANMTAVKAYGE